MKQRYEEPQTRYEFELNAGGLFESVVGKLPRELQSKWGKKVIKSHPEYLTLKDFIEWLHPIVKGEMVIKHGRSDAGVARPSKADFRSDAKQDRPAEQHQVCPVIAFGFIYSCPPRSGR